MAMSDEAHLWGAAWLTEAPGTLCERCVHSLFDHGEGDDRGCLFSECDCPGRLDAGET
jgi:hypothetical protein